jgi:serine/threonine protein kinase/WD40 repeat protein
VTDESIFAAALAIPSPAQRAAYLDRACAADPDLRRQVEELLAAHAADNPLDRPPADLALTGPFQPENHEPPVAFVGDRIGPYRLMEQIGEGGFGLVFVAEQTDPVRRQVALKIIKPGMDTRDVVARFEAERQALALMDHPNIAKVLDAGSTPARRPYFVMELVRGVPITDYCDQNKLPPRDRLTLFVQVCQAVQHAHQKGIIHRDLKPSNILVAPHDGVPVVKVIDFGVAKALGQSLTDKTIYTRFAQMIGTPLYMSPEQAEINQLGVDTRADVFALGVLLYELLTGTTPFDKDRLRQAAFDEIRRILKEEEPPRPSTRLSSLGATLPAVSANRKTDPARLAGLVRGELDWIVMRCLEKDRNRRYDSAYGLARDVERYLAGDAVEACPPTLGYRLRKAFRRHKTATIVGAGFAAVLLLGIAMTTWQAIRATDAEIQASQDRDDALKAHAAAEAERDNVAKANASLRRLTVEQRRTLYAASLNLAQAAWETGDAVRTFDLLRQQIPRPGEDDLRGFEWHYWNQFAHQDLKTVRLVGFPEIQGNWFGARLSPDGMRVAAFSTEPAGTVSLKLWDATTGKEVWSVPVPAGYSNFQDLKFSRDGRHLATGRYPSVQGERARSRGHELRVWDTATGKAVYAQDFRQNLSDLNPTLSPDGSRLAFVLLEDSPTATSRLTVRRIPDGEEIFRYPLEKSDLGISSLAFSPDGKRLAALARGRGPGLTWQVLLWDLESGQELRQIVLPGSTYVGVCFSPDGARLATPNINGPTDQVILWDTASGEKLQELRLPTRSGVWTAFYPVAFAPDGKRLAVRQGGQAYCLETATGPDAPPPTFRGHSNGIWDVAFGEGGTRLVTLDERGVVRWWDPAARARPLRTPLGRGFGGRAVLTNTDGSRIALGLSQAESDRRLRLTDRDGRLLSDTPLPPGHAHGLAFSRDGRTLALVCYEKGRGAEGYKLFVWDAVSGQVVRRLTLPAGLFPRNCALSQDGTRVAVFSVPLSGYRPQFLSLEIMETATGRTLLSRRLPYSMPAYDPAYSPDGRRLAFYDHRGPGMEARIVWLDARTGEEVAALKLGKASTSRERLVFSPDGRRMAIYPEDGRAPVRVWAIESLFRGGSTMPDMTQIGHAGEFTHVGFSSDGQRILTVGGGTVKIWDAVSGRELLTLKVEGTTIRAALFSPDGHTIWGGLDEDGRLWGWDGTPVPEAKSP